MGIDSHALHPTSTEAKKSRSSGRKPKDDAVDQAKQGVFAVFLRDAGVTLQQGGTSNEIGKGPQFKSPTLPDSYMQLVSQLWLFPI